MQPPCFAVAIAASALGWQPQPRCAVCTGYCSHRFWINTDLLFLPTLTHLSFSAHRQTEPLCTRLGAVCCCSAQGVRRGFWTLSRQICALCMAGLHTVKSSAFNSICFTFKGAFASWARLGRHLLCTSSLIWNRAT